jgi:hypothetical protein
MHGAPAEWLSRDATAAALVGVAVAVTALAAALVVGPVGMLAPVVAVGAACLLARPTVALGLLFAVVVLCEGDELGFAPGLAVVYEPVAAGVAPVDGLLALVVAAVALDVVRRREPLRLPGPLAFPLALFGLAAVAGVVAGVGRGASPVDALYEGRSLVYLVVVPIVAVNVIRTHAQLMAGVGMLAVLAVVKAALGLLALGAGQGRLVDGSPITYYEPLSNLLILMTLLAVLAAVLTGLGRRMPVWLVLASPALLACFVLSFRRSFWIGLVLGILLVVAIVSMSAAGRRVVLPVAPLVIAAVLALGTVGVEAQGPVAERFESLRPSSIAANVEDRYRIDERVNVLAELRTHPVTGLGLAVPWSSAERPLPVEHLEGRRYVHMVALWHWLKLGLLGLVAYLAVAATSFGMAWRIWRRHPDPLLRAVGLATACGLGALAAVETTGSFTGVENRVSIALGAALGALAVVYRDTDPSRPSIRRAIA